MENENQPNPYQAPTVEVLGADLKGNSGQLIANGRRVGISNSWEWIVSGWRLFALSPLIWIVNMILLFVYWLFTRIIGVIIPLGGDLITALLRPVIDGGLMLGCQALDRGEALEVNHLFAGFNKNAGSLFTVGALALVGGIAIVIIVAILAIIMIGSSGVTSAIFLNKDPEAIKAMMGGTFVLAIIVVVLVALLLAIPLAMALWFAPALIVFHDRSPIEAMTMSFYGCLKNFVPCLLFGLIILVFGILTIFTLFLGLFVLVPLISTGTYAAYRDIFVEPTA